MRLDIHYVDDSKTLLTSVRKALEASQCKLNGETVEYAIQTFNSVTDYKNSVMNSDYKAPDIMLLDLAMHGDRNAGVKLAKVIRETFKAAYIIMFTQFDDAKTITECMAAGVDNFLHKSEDFKYLPQAIIDTLRLSVRPSKDPPSHFAGSTLNSIYARIPGIMRSAIRAVSVQGETGCGKEVIADMFNEVVGDKLPFIRVNCGAIAPNLVESELMGHSQGAFTGAARARAGLFEVASGGWIFLDEVALLPEHAQRAVLRCIENQEVIRVGESKPRKINVKVLSATNESLHEGVKEGRFRRDLWQRLTEATIVAPPLRTRLEELPDLVNFFCRTMEGGPYIMPHTTLEVLKQYNWEHGNVRELRNTLRAMTEYQVDKVLWPKSVPEWLYHNITAKDGTRIASTHHDHVIQIPVSLADFSYHKAEDDLLAESIKLFAVNGKASLNKLQRQIGLAKSTLSRRVHDLLARDKLPSEMFDLVLTEEKKQ